MWSFLKETSAGSADLLWKWEKLEHACNNVLRTSHLRVLFKVHIVSSKQVLENVAFAWTQYYEIKIVCTVEISLQLLNKDVNPLVSNGVFSED